jgi:hypothetical protein
MKLFEIHQFAHIVLGRETGGMMFRSMLNQPSIQVRCHAYIKGRMSFTRQNIDAAAFFHFPKITSKMRSSLFSFHADVTSDLLESTVDKFGVDKEIKRFPAGTVYKFLKFRLFQQ